MRRRLAVLGFHKVGAPPANGWETWFYIPETTFVAQLTALKDAGWQVIGADAFLRGLTAPETLPARSALLTFDDGYQSMGETVVPHLRRFGYPAVLFVPTAFIGGRNTFEEEDEPDEPICTWTDLRDLERCGVSVQSHGVSHRAFSTLDPAQQRHELLDSKAILEDTLAKPIELFAFPYGDCGSSPAPTREALRRAGYRAAMLFNGGPNAVPVADAYAVERVAMGPDTDLHVELAQP